MKQQKENGKRLGQSMAFQMVWCLQRMPPFFPFKENGGLNMRTGAGEKLKLREADLCTQLPLAGKQLRIMGNHTSLGTKTVLVTLQLILLINNWTVYEPEIWDQTEVKVWDSATKNDKSFSQPLPANWQAGEVVLLRKRNRSIKQETAAHGGKVTCLLLKQLFFQGPVSGPSAVCKSLRSTLINKYVPERITVNYEAYLQGAYAMTEAAIRLSLCEAIATIKSLLKSTTIGLSVGGAGGGGKARENVEGKGEPSSDPINKKSVKDRTAVESAVHVLRNTLAVMSTCPGSGIAMGATSADE
ncbi:hypothetical protein Anapl_12616 [Anas platyrhynchos]|uniref:Uncharacterized protein n=1 Tax=Anas platyrhynchos TaxID=8839 RepID=R0K873_ANAPL|nr:hypothetical protein Anapl_12616 [Anas platyrhynchos]